MCATIFPYSLKIHGHSFFFFLNLFYLWLCWLRGLSLVGGKRGPLFIVVCGPLTIAASLVAEHRLQTRRLSNCGSRAQLLCGMWDLPRPGLEPVSTALAGRFSTTAPPGKPSMVILKQTSPRTWSCLLPVATRFCMTPAMCFLYSLGLLFAPHFLCSQYQLLFCCVSFEQEQNR